MNQENNWFRKHRNFFWGFAVVLLTAYLVLFLFVPTQKQIEYTGTVSEYSASDETVEIPHAVTVRGTLTKRVIGHNSFYGTFYIEGVEGQDRELKLSLTREKGRWVGGYETKDGEPMTAGVYEIASTQDMEDIVVALGEAGSFDAAGAHFLTLGASTRRGALEEFQGWFA
jgi:hypothetical protein